MKTVSIAGCGLWGAGWIAASLAFTEASESMSVIAATAGPIPGELPGDGDGSVPLESLVNAAGRLGQYLRATSARTARAPRGRAAISARPSNRVVISRWPTLARTITS